MFNWPLPYDVDPAWMSIIQHTDPIVFASSPELTMQAFTLAGSFGVLMPFRVGYFPAPTAHFKRS
jgi:hypothetical protein